MADSAIVGVPVEKRSVWAAVSNLFLRGYLRIGRRLAICFVAIVLSMLLSDLVAFWQFTRIAASERHLSDADQISLAVIRVHLDVDTFRDRLATLVNTHDTRQFETEAASVRQKFLEHVTHAQQLLKAVPGIGQDAGILSALSTLHITMQSQVDAVVELAHSDDWEAVRLRLADQIVALIRLSSSLVSRVDQELSQERAQAIENSRRAGRQLFLILPTTAVLTLLMAIALGWYATRSITGPLSALEAAARALARGEFEHEVAAPGRDELATVGKAFNYACRRLRELYDELRESEEQWRAAFVNNPTMYFMVDSASTILSVNAFGAEQLGYNEAELIGRPLLNFFYEGDREAVKKRADACFEQLGRRTRWEARTIRKDGTMLWIRETANAVILKKRPVLLIVCEDITERKWAEEERERLRKIEADLAHVDRVTTMGEMAASLAHELKQPIAAAATNASTCLRWLKRDRPDIDEACATAARIISDVNRANDIIIRVRSLYKKSAPERELVDVSILITEVVALLRSEATRYRISVRNDLPAEVPKVVADRVQVQQVLMNLILNSIQAMKDVDRNRELTIKSQPLKDGQLQISISDTGVGIPTDQTDQIFAPFFTTKPEGTGMGLAIARSIVESHSGRLWAAPNDGSGATFHLTLPTDELKRSCVQSDVPTSAV